MVICMKCPNCHSIIENKVMMCIHCGKIFSMEDGILVEVEQKKEKKRNPIDFTGITYEKRLLHGSDLSFQELYQYYKLNHKQTSQGPILNFYAFLFGCFWYFYEDEFILGCLNILLGIGLIYIIPSSFVLESLDSVFAILGPFPIPFTILNGLFCLAIINLVSANAIKDLVARIRIYFLRKFHGKKELGPFMMKMDHLIKTGWMALLLNILSFILVWVLILFYFRFVRVLI